MSTITKTTNIIYLWYHEIIIRYVIHWGKHSNLDCNFLCFTSNVICLVPINVITYKKFLYGNWASANTKTRFMSQYAMLHTILRKRGCKALFCMHDTNAKTRPWIKWAFKMPFLCWYIKLLFQITILVQPKTFSANNKGFNWLWGRIDFFASTYRNITYPFSFKFIIFKL